jgi:hypothetical protein
MKTVNCLADLNFVIFQQRNWGKTIWIVNLINFADNISVKFRQKFYIKKMKNYHLGVLQNNCK